MQEKTSRKKQKSTSQEYTSQQAVTAVTDLSLQDKEALYNLPESLKDNTIQRVTVSGREIPKYEKISGKKTTHI